MAAVALTGVLLCFFPSGAAVLAAVARFPNVCR